MQPTRLAASAGFTALFGVAAVLGRLTVLEGSTLNLIWPAAGVAALWALLHRDSASRWVDATLMVGVVTVVDVSTGTSLGTGVALGVVGLVQAVAFVELFRRALPSDQRVHGPLLLDLRALGALLAAAGVASAVGAVTGSLVVALDSGSWSLLELAVWQTRNAVAVLLVVPVGLRLRQALLTRRRAVADDVPSFVVPRGWRAVEVVIAVSASVMGHVLVFQLLPSYPIAFPLFALTVWVALRFDTGLTALRDLCVAVAAVASTLAGTGPFAQMADIATRALIVQAYAGLGAALGLTLALGRDERTVLMRRLRRSAAEADDRARQVQVLADASRSLLLAEDPRAAVCEAVEDATGADGVYLLEPDGTGHVVSSAVVGLDMPPVRVSADAGTSLIAHMLASGGQLVFASDASAEPRVSQVLVEQLRVASAAWQPAVSADDRVVALIGLIWHDRVTELPASTTQVLSVLGHEAARAIERGNLLEALARAADRDQLTGLANRRRWDELSTVEVSRAQRTHLPLTLLLLDLDHFKAFNDTFGHHRGDELLHDFAQAAAGCLREVDLMARWGGEEFAVALPDCSAADARPVAERILAAVPHGQTATVGIAQWSPGESAADTLTRADAALYRGKAGGRARAVVADQPAVVVPV